MLNRHLTRLIAAVCLLVALTARTAPLLSVQTTSWDTIGLDSNGDPGPSMYPVMANIINNGNQTASNVVVNLQWLAASTAITNIDSTNFTIGSIDPGQMALAHFLVGITTNKTAGKYDANQTNATRQYRFSVTGSNFTTTNTPAGTLVCQKLVSQNRNSIDQFLPTNSLSVKSGQIFPLTVIGLTSAQYDDCEPMIPFPNTLVHVLNMTQYFELAPGYVITNGTYGTNAGKGLTNYYMLQAVGSPGTSNRMSGVIYDLSNSSYHYNSDYGLDLTTLTLSIVTNRPPVASNDVASTTENVPVTVPALANDSDPDNDPLTIVSVSPTNGTASISGTNIIFTPATNFIGTGTVGYTVTDGNGGTNSAVATIIVTNIPPTANPDTASTIENTPITISSLTNDLVNTPGGSLSLIGVNPTGGTATINGTNILFTPATNFIGTATIVYTITDGIGGTNTGLITITIANIPPTANPDFASTAKNAGVTISPLINDVVNTPGGILALVSVSPTNGTASINGTNVLFTPATNFVGVATIGYTISDSIGGTNSSLITVTVTNRPPTAANDAASTPKNVAVTVSAVANDSDPDGDALTIVSVNSTNGTASIVNGTNVLFTPSTNFVGNATVGYLISDGFGGTNGALITISVTNRPPTAANDSASTPKNVSVTVSAVANDSDPDNDTLTIVSVNPTNGTASVVNGTNVLFTPSTNFIGNATVGYLISDGFGGTNGALIAISVTNRLPVALNDTASTPKNIAVTISAVANDSDPDNDALTIVSVNPTNGTASVVNGTNVLFTPSTNFIGNATVGYLISDGFGGTNGALITISVTNRPPVAANDSATTTENVPVTIHVLANDSDPDNDTLTIVGVNATNGVAQISGTNIVYTPGTNYVGTSTLVYTISDGFGGTNTATISVTSTNIPPTANPDTANGVENIPTTISPLTNDVVNTPGGTLSIISVNTTNGTANIVGTNIVFTPGTNFVGTVTLTYTVSDGIGGTNSSTITVTVISGNHPPVANGQTVSTRDSVPVIITLTGSDIDSDPLTYAIGANPTNGVLSLLDTNTGSVTYTPNAYYVGTDSFTFHANDGKTNSADATVTINVTPQADIAVFKTGPASGYAGSNITFTISVTNLGPSTASNVVAFDQLPAGYTFVSASASGTVSNNLVTWPAVTLARNTQVDFTVTVVSIDGGSFTNVAFATSGTYDPNGTNNDGTSPNSQTLTTLTPRADVAIYKTGGTNVLAGGTVNYTIVATNMGPSTASNVVIIDTLPAGSTFQTASGSYTLSNGVVTWSNVTLTNGGSVSYTISLTAPTSGSILNVASATADTFDSNTNNNNGSSGGSQVGTTITPVADVIVLVAGPTNILLGSNFIYTITVSNAGPSTASNIVTTDVLPLPLQFISASAGGSNFNGTITWPTIPSLLANTSSNFTLTVTSTNAGVVTNIASAFGTTSDPDLTNNNGSSANSQVQTTILAPVFAFGISSTPHLNPQTGLYEEQVIVTNIGTVTAAGVRLYVSGLRSGVTLYNASGTNNGVPYVQYNFPVNPWPLFTNNTTVSFLLEFYDPLRLAFTNTLSAVAIFPPNSGNVSTNGSVSILRVFADNRIEGDTRLVVEFNSIVGRTYTIIYSDDGMNTWQVATPTVTATANITQWYDDGPPKTATKPSARFYRVILN